MNSFDFSVKGLWESLRLRNHGTVYFVNGGFDGVTAGVDTNDGFTPANALLTIARALVLCGVGGNDDYIFCWNTKDSDTYPIQVSIPRVHIIGIGSPDGSFNELQTSDDNPVFQLTLEAGGTRGIEIAGFSLGGGATNGCIDVLGGQYYCWIHNCSFGFSHNILAQDGIRLTAASGVVGLIIEDCWFYGDSGTRGLLTQYGIVGTLTSHIYECTIRNNYFHRCTSGAIVMLADTVDTSIVGNKIACASDAVAMAIDLSAICSGNLIASNEAQHGDAVMAANPYRDQAVADENDWMCNQVGSVMKYPDEAMP